MEKAKIVNISNLYTIGGVKSYGFKKCFKIWIECDMNDADYMEESYTISDSNFRADKLKMCVISYLYSNHFDDSEPLSNDINFSWLEEYCNRNRLTVHDTCGDSYGHSITGFSLTYFNEFGVECDVHVPTPEEIFGDFETAKQEMNILYQNYVAGKNSRYY